MATASTSLSSTAPVVQGSSNFERAMEAFSNKISSIVQSPILRIASIPVNAGGGAIAATLFTSITPLGGALYGLTDLAATSALAWVGNKLGNSRGWQESTLFKVMNFVLPKIAGIGAGIGALALTGAVLTPGTVVALVVGTAVFSTLLALSIAGIMLGIGAYDGYQAYNNPPMESSATRV